MAEKFIQKVIKRPGALHRTLGVAKGEKIPASKLKVRETDSPRLKRQKNLAKTLRKITAKQK